MKHPSLAIKKLEDGSLVLCKELEEEQTGKLLMRILYFTWISRFYLIRTVRY